MASRARGNLYRVGERPEEGERFEALFRGARAGGVRVERIVASARVPPAEYLLPHDEWVALLAGRAELEVEGETLSLGPGDWVLLPAGTPHALRASSPDAIWLAVHVGVESEAASEGGLTPPPDAPT